jgi:predicted NACHT family NTPase
MSSLRGLKATSKGIVQIQNALNSKPWVYEDLAEKSGLSRSTVISFCTGKSIYRKNFFRFCEVLGLSWREISEDIAEVQSELPQLIDSIDNLVQTLRVQVREDIQQRCGTTRVLTMTHPVDANAIYMDVNIVDVRAKTPAKIDYQAQSCSSGDFNRVRFLPENLPQGQIDGLEAVDCNNRLMILGQPGAGKTTFLKRLAMLCSLGKRFADRVPIFVELKAFPNTVDQPELVNFIAASCSPQFGQEDCRRLMESGRGLVLLDGLDEVQVKDKYRVCEAIKDFGRRFGQNIIIVTSRIGAQEYIFQQFTEVEIAKFNETQIANFVKKWFQSKKMQQASIFLKKIESVPSVKQLATNPLLLTLLCLEFEGGSDFSASRAELYQRGLNVLLTKWDKEQGITRDAVYEHLSTLHKENLLEQLAFYTFKRGDYFFNVNVVEQPISQYIQDLLKGSVDPETFLVDSHEVLKSIESQHGLLVECAMGLYSFSHLSFHEYFATKYLHRQSDQQEMLSQLLSNLSDKRWQEIFLFMTDLLEPADALLQGIKAEADGMLQSDERLQEYLRWVQTKAASVQRDYKPASIRAYYFSLSPALDEALSHAHDRAFARDDDEARTRARTFALSHTLDDTLDPACAYAYALDNGHDSARVFALDKALSLALYNVLNRNNALNLDEAQVSALAFARALARALTLDLALDDVHALDHAHDVNQSLRQLYDAFPDTSPETRQDFEVWWKSEGQKWTDQLRHVLITHFNIGRKWPFTDDQKQKLQQYYAANELLVDCLRSKRDVSQAVREEIEETLLLPITEIERRKGNESQSP